MRLAHARAKASPNSAQTIPKPQHRRGRRPVPISDAVFAVVLKVYLTKSSRRAIPELNLAYERGYLEKPIVFNTIWAYLERQSLEKILRDLIVKSSLPLVSVESIFAVDSTGFVGSRYIRWNDIKYRGMPEHAWAKIHLACGVNTHVVTDAFVGGRDAADLAQLPSLLNTTVQNFTIQEVLAGKAYNSSLNQEVITAIGASAYIPFKRSHTGRRAGAWNKAFHRYHENREEFLEHYHQRSNVETVFMMIKTKFGDSVRSKTEIAMKNEVYCKVLCHNICCLIMSMHDLGLAPELLAESTQKGAAD